jgi:glutamyl-tRNA(Gln) amidotransferase subunit E
VTKFRATAPPPSPHDLNPRHEPALDFPDRDFGALGPRDYEILGFLSGLEVHQQLLTRRKLFCRCPAGRRVTRIDAEVLRHMRPTLSEMGQYDGCALMEFKTKKEIVYLLERGSVCTYEMDDTPPFEIDEEAVKIALEASLLFDLNLVNELQVMRKQYLDGSIPTGFQRTAMVGCDGVIPFRTSELGRDRTLRIRQLTLEEDSCREVNDVGHRITFRTDRLGTPLIETVTEPDFTTPRDVAAGGRLIADVVHASGRVRRGAGAARQDVNVSVAGGRRVELKGVPSQRILPLLVHNEAFRQLNLLRVRHDLLEKGRSPKELVLGDVELAWESPLVVDARSILRRCEYPPVESALGRGEMVVAIKLAGFARALGHPTQPGITFAREIADRVRVIACLEAHPFMISSRVSDYGLGPAEWRHLRSALSADADDGIVVVWGPEDDVDTAAREILIRARDAFDGVPSETRQAFADGTSGFERILPGAERMYPDTDTPPVPIPEPWVSEIEARLPERPWQAVERFVASGLGAEASERLLHRPWLALYESLARELDRATAPLVAAAFERTLPRALKRKKALPSADRLRPLVTALATRALPGFAFEPALERLMLDDAADASDLVRELAGADGPRLIDAALDEVRARQSEAWSSEPESLLGWAMGIVMHGRRGRVDPRLARERLLDFFASPKGRCA